jgi:hypothetical protein
MRSMTSSSTLGLPGVILLAGGYSMALFYTRARG